MSGLTKFAKNVVAIALLFLLFACKQVPIQPAYSSNITESELLQGEVILGRKLLEEELPEDDVLAVSPEMALFVEDNLRGVDNYFGKIHQLSRAIFDEDKLGLSYDPLSTYSARGAFENSVANCLSFSFLFYTLAKEMDLKVEFQEVHILPQWDLSAEELYVVSKHVNVRVRAAGNRDLVVDIDAVAPEMQIDYTILDENYVIALYYGNIGAELLMENKMQDAFRYFVKAIRLDYDNSVHWTNLGVLYRRAGHDEQAEKAYYLALDFNNDDKAALSNLAHLYREAGDDQRADYFSDMVKKYHADNPFYYYSEAKDALAEQEFKQALNHINRAIDKNKNIAIFYEIKSDILNQLGNSAEANRTLRKAQSLSADTL